MGRLSQPMVCASLESQALSSSALSFEMSAKEEEQLAKDRRASRKAAAACLARQRHKSFVNSLQDSAQFVRYRIDLYKSRKGQLVSERAP